MSVYIGKSRFTVQQRLQKLVHFNRNVQHNSVFGCWLLIKNKKKKTQSKIINSIFHLDCCSSFACDYDLLYFFFIICWILRGCRNLLLSQSIELNKTKSVIAKQNTNLGENKKWIKKRERVLLSVCAHVYFVFFFLFKSWYRIHRLYCAVKIWCGWMISYWIFFRSIKRKSGEKKKTNETENPAIF